MARRKKHDGEMRSHYDFSGGVRGKYAVRYSKGTSVIVSAVDVVEVFPDFIAVTADVCQESQGQSSAEEWSDDN